MQSQIARFGGLFDLDALNESIALNEHRMAEPAFGKTNKRPKN